MEIRIKPEAIPIKAPAITSDGKCTPVTTLDTATSKAQIRGITDRYFFFKDAVLKIINENIVPAKNDS